jgi:hypothetical protein
MPKLVILAASNFKRDVRKKSERNSLKREQKRCRYLAHEWFTRGHPRQMCWNSALRSRIHVGDLYDEMDIVPCVDMRAE